MADGGEGDATKSSERLETAIRELKAQVTEDLLNVRARLLAVEQELDAVKRGGAQDEERPREEAPPRPRRRAEGRDKRGRAAKAQARAKRAGDAQRKPRRDR